MKRVLFLGSFLLLGLNTLAFCAMPTEPQEKPESFFAAIERLKKDSTFKEIPTRPTNYPELFNKKKIIENNARIEKEYKQKGLALTRKPSIFLPNIRVLRAADGLALLKRASDEKRFSTSVSLEDKKIFNFIEKALLSAGTDIRGKVIYNPSYLLKEVKYLLLQKRKFLEGQVGCLPKSTQEKLAILESVFVPEKERPCDLNSQDLPLIDAIITTIDTVDLDGRNISIDKKPLVEWYEKYYKSGSFQPKNNSCAGCCQNIIVTLDAETTAKEIKKNITKQSSPFSFKTLGMGVFLGMGLTMGGAWLTHAYGQNYFTSLKLFLEGIRSNTFIPSW